MAIDIDQSHINTGTATVAANGTAVTGQGTTWQGIVRKGDMWGTHRGSGVRILSVNSNTSLTLAYPWLGGAQTAAAYEIQRTPYDVGYLQAIEEMIRLYGIGILPSLAGLDGAGGDKGVMLTGAGAAATFAVTPYSRTLMDDLNAAAARGTLETVKQTGPLDATAGRLALVDAFGLGPGAIDVPNLTDASVSMTRFFRVLAGAIGAPAFGAVVALASGGLGQTEFLTAGVRRGFIGHKANTTATPTWTEIVTDLNAVGTVTAGGVALFQVVANVNGIAFKMKGGLMIAIGMMSAQVTNTAFSTGLFYNSTTSSGNFAAEFIEAPTVIVNAIRSDAAGATRITGAAVIPPNTTSTGGYRSISNDIAHQVSHSYVAIGRHHL